MNYSCRTLQHTAKNKNVWNTCTGMHQNVSFTGKISIFFWGGGTSPSPDPISEWEGYTPPQTPLLPHFSGSRTPMFNVWYGPEQAYLGNAE